MFCGNCGNKMNEGERFCNKCGFDMKPGEKKEEAKEENFEQVEVKPTNNNQPVNNAPAPVQNNANEPAPVIGICAIIFTFLFWPVGLVLGIIAIAKGKTNKANKILGIISTILSALALVFTILFIIIFAAAWSTTVDEYNGIRDTYEDTYNNNDYSTTSDVKETMMGKWTCTESSNNEKVVFNFMDDDKFSATHGSDKIEGNFYAYEDYSNKNKANVYIYYYDIDNNYESDTLDFVKSSDKKATIIVEELTLICTK